MNAPVPVHNVPEFTPPAAAAMLNQPPPATPGEPRVARGCRPRPSPQNPPPIGSAAWTRILIGWKPRQMFGKSAGAALSTLKRLYFFPLVGNRDKYAPNSFDWPLHSLSLLPRVRHLWWPNDYLTVKFKQYVYCGQHKGILKTYLFILISISVLFISALSWKCYIYC